MSSNRARRRHGPHHDAEKMRKTFLLSAFAFESASASIFSALRAVSFWLKRKLLNARRSSLFPLVQPEGKVAQ